MTTTDPNQVRRFVEEKYASAALTVLQTAETASCCGSTPVTLQTGEGARAYLDEQLAQIPVDAARASLGCGNPTALINLQEGQTVLDLGSGGGIDVLLSARRVGPTGKAYGLDMTDAMLELAAKNAANAGVTNVEFLKGHIEQIPLPDNTVDVIISNCVINLSTDKGAVLREAFRVLAPGGRFAVSDIVVIGPPLGAEVQQMLALWAGCVAGALTEEQYREYLAEAGFIDIEVVETNDYRAAERGLALEPGQRVISAFVRATKPH